METAAGFVQRHPDNPRYLLFRGKPLAAVTAGEHYGAVLNLDFDYVRYLDALREKGFRLTRAFLFYREQPGSFSGHQAKDGLYFPELGLQNPLAPAAESYIAPWRRSGVPGSYDGGCKFDLNCLNEGYFERLKDFCRQASNRGILVEVTLFSNMYSDDDTGPWLACPLNALNNINGVGDIPHHAFMSLARRDVVSVLEALAARTVQELRDFDNIYYEICNEPNPLPTAPHLPYEDIAAWQNHFVHLIWELERGFPQKHMIAVCDPNRDYDLTHVSILNFHYQQWADNGLDAFGDAGRVLAFDETLSGIVAWNREMDFEARRREAWTYIMKGFGVYNYLDFTYATLDPTGTGQTAFPGEQYYNGEVMRLYLKHLNDFMNGLDFIAMQPDDSFIEGRFHVASAHGLALPGKAYAVYLNGNSLKHLTLRLPAGGYRAQWYNPRTGVYAPPFEVPSIQGRAVLEIPLYEQDVALKLEAIS